MTAFEPHSIYKNIQYNNRNLFSILRTSELTLSCFSVEPSELNNWLEWRDLRQNYPRLSVLYFLPLQYGDIIRLFPGKR